MKVLCTNTGCGFSNDTEPVEIGSRYTVKSVHTGKQLTALTGLKDHNPKSLWFILKEIDDEHYYHSSLFSPIIGLKDEMSFKRKYNFKKTK